MGIQATVKATDFIANGGVVEMVEEKFWEVDGDGEEFATFVTQPLFVFPSGLVASSYHPDDLVFDCKNANQNFVQELVDMGCPFVRS